jgi:hypothetical protein
MHGTVHTTRTIQLHPIARGRSASRGGHVRPGAAYLIFCAAIVLVTALLTFTSFMLGPRSAQQIALQQVALPVATIQFTPDVRGVCKRLKFHNDSGRFEDDGKGPCRDLIPAHMIVETVRGGRANAIARAFSFR